MNIYNYRKKYLAHSSLNNKIEGKLTFKTKEIEWIETDLPSVIPISIDSCFHQGIDGDLKMNAFLSVLKEQIKGKITILMTEKAHLHVLSLQYQGDNQSAYIDCLKRARELESKFAEYFEGTQVVYLDDYIVNDSNYELFSQKIQMMYHSDPAFKNLVNKDAELTYTPERAFELPDKDIYMQKAIQDILEHNVGLLVLVHKGYRFQFYPGNQYLSMDYVNDNIHESDHKISHIKVFLKIDNIKNML